MPPVHDYVIANGTGAAVRSDLNDALAAIVSNNSSSSEPATTYAYQWWADTTANVLKIRNSANNAWITLRELDGTLLMEDGSASAPGLSFASDTNTGFFSGGADKIGFATGGAERLEIGSSEVVFNDPSNDVDFRVESNGQTHMLFVDAGNDRVGIGTSSAFGKLQVKVGTDANFSHTTASSEASLEIINDAGSANVPLNVRASEYKIKVDGNEKIRIDSSGRLLVGTTSSVQVYQGATAFNSETQIAGSSASLTIARSIGSGNLFLTRNQTVIDNAPLGVISFNGGDGTNLIQAAQITAEVDGTPGSNDMPGRLVFSTCADGASSPTERVRVDSSGNVGVGTTSPNSFDGSAHQLVISNSSHAGITIDAASTHSSNIHFADGPTGNESYRGVIQYHHDGDSMRFKTAASERMRLDSSGRVGIGLSSPSQPLHVDCGAPGGSDKIIAQFQSESSRQLYIGWDDSQSTMAIGTNNNHDLCFHTNGQNTERMRITSNSLLIGRTNNSENANVGGVRIAANGTSYFYTESRATLSIARQVNNGTAVEFRRGSGTPIVGTISVTTSATSYNTSSDYRLKENIVDLDGAITRVKQLLPKRFNFLADTGTTVDGFLAHEAQTVVPEAVTGTHDEVDDDNNPVYQGIDQSKLVPLLTAALQEAITKIETLEAKVAALEAG